MSQPRAEGLCALLSRDSPGDKVDRGNTGLAQLALHHARVRLVADDDFDLEQWFCTIFEQVSQVVDWLSQARAPHLGRLPRDAHARGKAAHAAQLASPGIPPTRLRPPGQGLFHARVREGAADGLFARRVHRPAHPLGEPPRRVKSAASALKLLSGIGAKASEFDGNESLAFLESTADRGKGVQQETESVVAALTELQEKLTNLVAEPLARLSAAMPGGSGGGRKANGGVIGGMSSGLNPFGGKGKRKAIAEAQVAAAEQEAAAKAGMALHDLMVGVSAALEAVSDLASIELARAEVAAVCEGGGGGGYLQREPARRR